MSKRTKPPTDRKGETHKITIGGTDVYVTLNRLPDGRPIELFIKASKTDEHCWQGPLDTLAVTASIAMQYDAPLDTILGKWRGQRYEPSQIGVGSSIVDAIARRLMPQEEPT